MMGIKVSDRATLHLAWLVIVASAAGTGFALVKAVEVAIAWYGAH